jgi:hypothetical protein
MYTDQLLLPRLLKLNRRLDRVPSWNQAALANWPGIFALVVAAGFGSYGSGILPGQSGSPLIGWGIVPLEAWLMAAAIYIGLAAVIARSPNPERLLGFPQETSDVDDPAIGPIEAPVAVSAG